MRGWKQGLDNVMLYLLLLHTLGSFSVACFKTKLKKLTKVNIPVSQRERKLEISELFEARGNVSEKLTIYSASPFDWLIGYLMLVFLSNRTS